MRTPRRKPFPWPYLKGLLSEIPSLERGGYTGRALFQCILRIADFNADLLLHLFSTELSLAKL